MNAPAALLVCPETTSAGSPELRSLLDMLRFYAASFTAAISKLQAAEGVIGETGSRLGPHDHMPPDRAELIASLVGSLGKACEGLPLSLSLRKQIERLDGWMREFGPDNDVARGVLMARVQEIKHNVVNELAEHLCLLIPAVDKFAYLEPEKWFSPAVVAAFPDVRMDIRDSVRCLALEQWTASVYHAMGIAQHGLYWLASHLQVPFARPIELENWKNIIDQIEKSIRAMEQRPKTLARDDALQFHSTVASHFFYIKEAWRNHVMHVRARYDEDEARRVVGHVRDIMTSIADRAQSASHESAPGPLEP